MPRDKEIKRAFEIADDAMQGVIGYFLYIKEAKQLVTQDDIIKKLPPSHIQITFEWQRSYNPKKFTHEMDKYFLYYHARTALVSLISTFEGALKKFIKRLIDTNNIRNPVDSYKKRLEWAFELTNKSIYGTGTMIKRIPLLCLHIDHARRIRNLWMHNNGLFDKGYEDVIKIVGHNPIIIPGYEKYRRDNRKQVPCILVPNFFNDLAFSHVELLHHIHDTIQRLYFGQKRSYGYRALKKKIEWHRMLIGK